MSYDVLGASPLDYLPCRYGTSKLMFRGPKRDLTVPYVAFVGGTETYGRFIETPFPELVEKALGQVCVNFGQVNAGVDAFCLDAGLVKTIGDAEVSVVQVMGAQNMTNRFYSVHPRRNDRFVGASTLLQTIFREVDFSDFHFNKHLLQQLRQVSEERFQAVRQELQEAWKARMKLMLKQFRGKTVLLWISDQPPKEQDAYCDETEGSDPMLITQDMIDEIRPLVTDVVEVVASAETISAGPEGMILSEMDHMAAAQMLGPKLHRQVADALIPCIQQMRN
ncbi:MAG: DUF6473 family protein [Sulfitobacter sp.]